jgi:hypothetical protein
MSDGRVVWRKSLLTRVFLWVLVVLFVVLAVVPASPDGFLSFPPTGDEGYYSADVPYRFGYVALAAGAAVLAVRGQMELADGRLTLQYVFHRKQLPLVSILAVTPTREGLVIETTDGRTHYSPTFVVEKAPISTWRGRRTRADDMADAILAARPGA